MNEYELRGVEWSPRVPVKDKETRPGAFLDTEGQCASS